MTDSDSPSAADPPAITQEVIKTALGSFKTPTANTNPLTDLTIVKLRLSKQPPDQRIALIAILQDVLLGAMARLTVEVSHPPRPSLIRKHYVMGKEAKDICREEHISESTFFRRQRLELSELAGILMQMEDEAQRQLAVTPQAALTLIGPLPELFVGREAHLARAKELLPSQPALKVVAFVGLPGAGKSTLAAFLTQDQDIQHAFTDGVLWANIGQEGDIASCLAIWASALGISPTTYATVSVKAVDVTAGSLAGIIRSRLAHRRMLLVLDDVWSLEDANALLLGGPECGYVLTTNSPALARMIALDGVVEVGELDEASARQLLHWHVPATVLTQAAVDPVILDQLNVTHRFGDLPLEVIRAARDLRSLAASGQTQRLLDYLTAPDTNAAPRPFQRVGGELALISDAPDVHMKQRIQRSLSLLPLESLAALGALTVFDPKPNSFREQDALAVAACDRGTLYALVDAGLVEPWHGRYTIHRSIWQVARQQPATQDSRVRLAEHFVKALSNADKLALSAADARNIKRALEAAQSEGLHDSYARIANGAFLVFDHPGEHGFIEEALMRIGGMQDVKGLSAPVLARLGRLRLAEGRAAEARTLSEQAVQQANDTHDSDTAIMALQTMADIELDSPSEVPHDVLRQAFHVRESVQDEQTMMRVGSETVKRHLLKGQLAQVQRFLLRTVPDELEERSGSAANLALAYTAKGWFEWLHGDVQQAQARLTRMLARTRERNFRMPYLFAVGALSWLMIHRGDYERAGTLANELLAAPDRDAVPDFVACAYNVLGQSAADRGDVTTALQLLDKGIGYASLHEIASMVAGLNVTKARVHATNSALAHAKSAATTAQQLARDHDSRPMACCAAVMLGTIAGDSGERERAADYFNSAAGYVKSQGMNDPWTRIFYQRRFGAFLIASDQSKPAITALNDSLALAQRLLSPDDQAESLFGLAQAHHALGDHDRVRQYGYESLEIHRRLGHRGFVRTGTWLTANGLDVAAPAPDRKY